MIFLRFMFTGTDLESQDYKGKKAVRYKRFILLFLFHAISLLGFATLVSTSDRKLSECKFNKLQIELAKWTSTQCSHPSLSSRADTIR